MQKVHAMTLPAPMSDADVPTTHVGTIPPNYYCRAWNPRRLHYCRQRAGWGTSHAGTGRCRVHDGGGEQRIVHGQHRRYAGVTTTRLRELIAQHESDPDPMSVLPELAAARAALDRYLELMGDAADPKTATDLLEAISRMVKRAEDARAANAVSWPELNRLMTEMGRVVERYVPDSTLQEKIRDGWIAIRL